MCLPEKRCVSVSSWQPAHRRLASFSPRASRSGVKVVTRVSLTGFSMIATCDADGVPNITYLSQVHLIDGERVALSCQFFNKTKKNVLVNPYATTHINDPLTLDAYRIV